MKRNLYIYYQSLILVGVTALLPFLLVCQYIHPVNDDYVYAIRNGGMGAFDGVVSTYANWSGRYFATLISSVNPLLYGGSSDTLYKLYSAVLVLLFACSLFVMIRAVFRQQLTNVQQLAFASMVLVLFLIQAPRISEFFYWFSSYVAYTVPCVLAMLLLAVLSKRSAAMIAVQSLLIMCIIGSNEVMAVLLVCTLIYWAFEKGKGRRVQTVVLLSVMTASMVAVIASPGNYHRMAGQLSAHPYLWASGVSIVQTVSWNFIWLPTLLLATVVYIPLFGMKIAGMDIFDRSMKKYLCFVAAAVFLAHIPPTLGLSSVMIGRTADNLYLCYILFYLFGLQILLHRYGDAVRVWLESRVTRTFVAVMYVAFLFLCVFQIDTPVATAYIDMLSGKAASYDRTMVMRQKAVGDNHIVGAVNLQPLGLLPKTIYVNDLCDDSASIFNVAYRDYYGLRHGVVVNDSRSRYLSNYESLFLMGKNIRKSK